jgi:S1-C subfamily serine protease
MLTTFSTQLADLVAAAAPSVVQVRGGRHPASGIALRADSVLTTTSALGREEQLVVRRADGQTLDAELKGWDPATGLAVLSVEGLGAAPLAVATEDARVGEVAIALARSWSNSITASAGLVSVIGGPLRTGRRRAIDRVIRTSAPMHDGFAGGPLLDARGRLIGVATAAAIRGLHVVIPSSIAVRTAEAIAEHGTTRRGYLGLAGQRVTVPAAQRGDGESDASGVLVVHVQSGSPAAAAGVLLGDVVLGFDGHPVESAEDLLDLLTGERIGTQVPLRISRGGALRDLEVVVGARASS